MQLTRGHYLAIGITGIIVVWMLSGIFSSPELAATHAPVQPKKSELFSVQVERYETTPITPVLTIHGETAPNRAVHIKAEVAGIVSKINAREGEFVKKGQVIIELNPKDKVQKLAQARALLKQRNYEHEANKSLIDKGLQNKTKLAQTESLLAAAQAQVTAIRISLEATKIKAPFAGVLEDRQVELGSYIKTGGPVISVLDYNPFIVKGYASEKDLPLIGIGSTAQAETIDGKTTSGTIRYVSTQANKASRTFAVELEIENPSERQADGVTASILIPLAETNAIYISPALLSLNEKGILGAKYVAEDKQVRFSPLSIIKAEASGIWVAGTPSPVDLIITGQSFVSPGEKVNPVFKQRRLEPTELSQEETPVENTLETLQEASTAPDLNESSSIDNKAE